MMPRGIGPIRALAVCSLLTHAAVAQIPADQLEFFEKKIRPVLVEKCYACHSAKLAKPMGGLRLDSRAGTLKGGDSGPAVKPGDPAGSEIVKAISYQNLDLKMPPSGKLRDQQISDFTEWIKLGAPDPRAEADAPASSRKASTLRKGGSSGLFSR